MQKREVFLATTITIKSATTTQNQSFQKLGQQKENEKEGNIVKSLK